MASPAVFLLCSDDPLLKNDRSAEIIAAARRNLASDAGFLLFTSSDLQSSGGLTRLETELMDPGLFGGDRIIKIYLKDLDKTGLEVCAIIAERMRSGICIIIDLPRIKSDVVKAPAKAFERAAPPKKSRKKGEAKAARTKTQDSAQKNAIGWLKAIGAAIEVMYPPEGPQLSAWIAERAKSRYQLFLNPDAVNYLALAFEGNLTALDQSLQILQIADCGRGKQIGLDLILKYMSQDARFTGFELADAVFNAQSERALNILSSLSNEPGGGRAAAVPLQVTRLDSALNAVIAARGQKISPRLDYASRQAFFRSFRIFSLSSQNAVLRAAAQMPDQLLDYINATLAEASRAVSTFETDRAYLCLQRICVCVRNFQVMNLRPL